MTNEVRISATDEHGFMKTKLGQFKKWCSGVDWVLVVIAGVAGGLLVLMLYGIHRRETVTMPAAYAAWCKLSGNSNLLTYAEWRALVVAGSAATHNHTAVRPITVP